VKGISYRKGTWVDKFLIQEFKGAYYQNFEY
jgi:hypothetical protein